MLQEPAECSPIGRLCWAVGLCCICAPRCLLVLPECAVTAFLTLTYFLQIIFLVIRLAWDLRHQDAACYWMTSIVLASEEKW